MDRTDHGVGSARWHGLVLGLALGPVLAGGCSGAGGGVEAPVGAPGEATDELAVVTPARWIYHPREAPTASAALPLGDGRCVVATSEGERWLVPAAKGDTCGGVALGTAVGAPEGLRRVVRDGATLRFVGESGTLYEATDPLGAFTRVVVPPEPLGRVATRGPVTVGLASSGTPYRLEGDGWVRGDAGGARLFDVDVDAGGRALAVAWPESVLASTDEGKTFRPVSPAPASIGAVAVVSAADGTLGVAGVHGQLALGAGGALTPSPRRLESGSDEPVAEVEVVPIAPSAAFVAQGRAAIAGRRWYEARLASELPERGGDGDDSDEETESGWTLIRGRLGGPLATVPLAGLDADREVRLAAHGRTVAVATIGEPIPGDRGARLIVRRSLDEGATFVDVARLVAPDIRVVRLAVGASGDLLVAGACAPAVRPSATRPAGDDEDEDDDEPACRPRAPVVVRPGARPPSTSTVVAGLAADLRGGASSPAFSPDGAIAYFLGRRAKGQEPSIFVSDDGGKSWDARPMSRRASGGDDGEDDEHRESWEDEPRRSGDGAIEILGELPLTVDAEGTLGFAVQTPSAPAWVVADGDGEVRTILEAPEADALIAGVGRRALAVSGSGDGLTVWEADGSGAWSSAGTLRVRLAGDLGVSCSAAGCVVGDALTRLGWEGREEAPLPPARLASTRPPAVRTPLVCDLDPKGWSALPSIEGNAPFPTVDEIARGRAAWSVLGVDRARGATTVHHVAEGGDGRIVARPLLEPTSKKGAVSALRLSHQGEGYAVSRWVEGARELDVAWVNFFEGTFAQRAVPLPAGPAPRTTTEGGIRNLDTGLVSVASGGVFVQPSAASRDAVFLDARGASTPTTLPDWSQVGISGRARTDAARIGGRTVFVGVVDAGPTVGLLGVRPDGKDLAVEATTLAPPTVGTTVAAAVGWTYVGANPGFVAVAGDPAGDGWSAAVWRAFGADGKLGPPVAGATTPDLPERPRPCRAEEVRSTPRIESHLVAPGGTVLARGHRHPVIIPGAGDGATPDGALHLLTAGAVLHGTPSSPCVAGWEATGIDGRRAGAVILGDLARAWIFRIAPPLTGAPRPPSAGPPSPGTVDVEVRAMACRWDPGAAVSEGVWDETGVR